MRIIIAKFGQHPGSSSGQLYEMSFEAFLSSTAHDGRRTSNVRIGAPWAYGSGELHKIGDQDPVLS